MACCSLKQRAMLSCLIPICLGSIVICAAYMDLDSQIYVFVCLIMGSVTISTGIMGIFGVAAKVTAALEVASPLLGVESALAIIMGSLFIMDLRFLKRFPMWSKQNVPDLLSSSEDALDDDEVVLAHARNIRMFPFLSAEAGEGEQFILQHAWVGYTAASLLIVLGIMGLLVIDLLGSYKTELDVDQMVKERAHFWRHTSKSPSSKTRPSEESADEASRLMPEAAKARKTRNPPEGRTDEVSPLMPEAVKTDDAGKARTAET